MRQALTCAAASLTSRLRHGPSILRCAAPPGAPLRPAPTRAVRTPHTSNVGEPGDNLSVKSVHFSGPKEGWRQGAPLGPLANTSRARFRPKVAWAQQTCRLGTMPGMRASSAEAAQVLAHSPGAKTVAHGSRFVGSQTDSTPTLLDTCRRSSPGFREPRQGSVPLRQNRDRHPLPACDGAGAMLRGRHRTQSSASRPVSTLKNQMATTFRFLAS